LGLAPAVAMVVALTGVRLGAIAVSVRAMTTWHPAMMTALTAATQRQTTALVGSVQTAVLGRTVAMDVSVSAVALTVAAVASRMTNIMVVAAVIVMVSIVIVMVFSGSINTRHITCVPILGLTLLISKRFLTTNGVGWSKQQERLIVNFDKYSIVHACAIMY